MDARQVVARLLKDVEPLMAALKRDADLNAVGQNWFQTYTRRDDWNRAKHAWTLAKEWARTELG